MRQLFSFMQAATTLQERWPPFRLQTPFSTIFRAWGVWAPVFLLAGGPFFTYADDLPEDVKRVIALRSLEKTPAYQDKFLAERRHLERALDSKHHDPASPEKLKLLAELGRSYLGTELTQVARDEEKARAIIAQIKKEYASTEFTALLLAIDLTASLRDSGWDSGKLFDRCEACFAVLEVPHGEIVDSTLALRGNTDPGELQVAALGLRESALERLKSTLASPYADGDFAIAQLQSISKRLPTEYELVRWAKAQLALRTATAAKVEERPMNARNANEEEGNNE